MGEIVKGLGPAERERVASLLRDEHFFWVDVSLSDAGRDELGDVLGIEDHALRPLLDFREDTRPSRKFHVDGKHVAFAFSCYLDPADFPIEVNVLISGDYVLTVHEEAASLPDVLDFESPEGRSEQYFIYAVLEAMMITAFDALNEVELTLERLQLGTADPEPARVRLATVRSLNSQLSGMRRRFAPHRGIFERISEEIGRVDGIEPDSERYF